MKIIDAKTIEAAYERIKRYINKTPLVSNNNINNQFGAQIYFKLENNLLSGNK